MHVGIPFGPNVYTKGASSESITPPTSLNPDFNAMVTSAYLPTLMAKLEEARRTSSRLLLSFSGNEQWNRDEDGFDLETWKRRVDRFRSVDFSSYIADGTIIGHFIMDEPGDADNWNGHVVPLATIEEMARYSKSIWPDLPAIIRGWPDYLKGYRFQYLDAAWAQYHVRFGSLEQFIANNVRDAKANGLALIMGLNVVAGGGAEEGIPGYHGNKYAMTAAMVRTWGATILAEPYVCAFFMFRFNSDYFGRADIKDAVADLSERAKRHPMRGCVRSE